MQSGIKEFSFSHQKSLDRGYPNKESKQALPSQEMRPKLIEYYGKPEEGIDATKQMVEKVESKQQAGRETISKRGEGLRRKSFGLIAEKVRAL